MTRGAPSAAMTRAQRRLTNGEALTEMPAQPPRLARSPLRQDWLRLRRVDGHGAVVFDETIRLVEPRPRRER